MTAEASVVARPRADHPDASQGRRHSGGGGNSAQHGRGDRRPAGRPPRRERDAGTARPTAPAAGLTPISARVSVGVPASYLKKVWHERHPDPPGQDPATPDAAALDQIGVEESAKIRRHVAQLLPPTQTHGGPGGAGHRDDVRRPPGGGAAAARRGAAGVELARRVVAHRRLDGAGPGLLALVAVGRPQRSGLQGWSRSAAGFHVCRPPSRRKTTLGSRLARSAPALAPARRHGSPPTLLRRQLSELVEADPETAAGILRNWIGQAS